MTDKDSIIFLGVNDTGRRVYDWLCDRDDVFVHSLLTTKDQLRLIKDVEPEYVVSCGYRHLVPVDILDIPSGGCLNLHPAYLPYNRGANPNVWSIVDGTPAGVSLHYMTPELDAGDIIARREVETDFSDTGKSLYNRLEDAQVDLFKEIWPKITTDEISIEEQDPDTGTYHRTSDFDELCRLDPNETVKTKELLDRLRALTFPPYDNALIKVDGETYTVEVQIERKK